jgi:hypothetical protein
MAGSLVSLINRGVVAIIELSAVAPDTRVNFKLGNKSERITIIRTCPLGSGATALGSVKQRRMPGSFLLNDDPVATASGSDNATCVRLFSSCVRSWRPSPL